jgi:hypothetical protein
MKTRRWRLRHAAAAISGLALTATALVASAPAGAQAATAQGPTVKLIVAQNKITVSSFGGGEVFLDPGIYVASLRSALVFHVQRASYARPITISQIVRLSSGATVSRPWPSSVLDGFNGLRNFARLRVTNSKGKVVHSSTLELCPNNSPQRTSPDSQTTSPYPQECAAFDPFQKAIVWGVARGWAVEPGTGFGLELKLSAGQTYKITETITPAYLRLLHISARDATGTVTAKVVKGQGDAPNSRRTIARHGSLPSLPSVRTLRHPPASALPDLVPLPSWGISISHTKATKKQPAANMLDFGATVSIGGNAPLDVEGFRSNGSPTMKAYQYFWRNGRIIGRARAGTMGFADYNNWHFQQFAQYRLLSSSKKLVVRSHKEGFCIAPTDPIDLLLPGAVWQPSFIGLGGECGDPAALWVQEMLPLGWADTYDQFIPGDAFDVTHVPNGTYYIEVIANPQKLIHETDTRNDVSLRKVILGGTLSHRTVRVPAFDGIDPES